ncbi:hypothetical protein FLONG3_4898 [Fusarium longipes]|uniref:Zn(2)-C6 fungal-type domain-containing protein n=1 Tax=Fusarium longipes TaxID=694270 RepID=A0A395SWW3_9HYPO|nr:hypothetical protein FLONG3_4898 [Fusarium longipes]
MPREGTQRVKTGCRTCKARKIKCDETWPKCKRCTTTRRVCDGYSAPPVGSLSWDLLLRAPQPRLVPVTNEREVRSLSFFHHVVAPALSGPFDASFWTYFVARMTHSEPAARHSVLAISQLFEDFEYEKPSTDKFAITHYNTAINLLVHGPPPSVDTVLLVCVLFICVEFLRGNRAAAITHAAHGVHLLNAAGRNSRLAGTWSKISVFPTFFIEEGVGYPLSQKAGEGCPIYSTTSEAQYALDSLILELLRIIRAANPYRLEIIDVDLPQELYDAQRQAKKDLDAWEQAFNKLQCTRSAANREDTASLGLMVRHRIMKIWISECLKKDEMCFDVFKDEYVEILVLVRKAAAILEARRKKPTKFTFETGFSPMLHFMVYKCRYLPLRLEFLSLLRRLSSERESLWNGSLVYTLSRRIVEVEHGIDLSGDYDANDDTLPPDSKRIRGFVFGESQEVLIWDVSPEDVVYFRTWSPESGALILYLLTSSFAAASPATQTQPHITLAARQPSTTEAPQEWFTTTKNIATIGGTTDEYYTRPAKTIQIVIPTCVQTFEPDENGYLPPGTCNANWNYYPNFSAAAVFAVLFAILTGAHIWQAARYKKSWCWVIIMAGIWETTAFTFRAISTKHQQSIGVLLVFQIFILLAPIWVNAYAYMTLGRMVYYFIPNHSLLGMPAVTLAAIFVGLDIVSFIIQLIGGSLAGPGSPPDEQLKAIHIYMGGIGLQEFFIIIFIILCIAFQRKMHEIRAEKGIRSFIASDCGKLLLALYFSLAMISVRIIYRLIEFSGGEGQRNPLMTHEIYFYILEAAPMFLALLVFNIVHPGKTMQGPLSEMPGLFSFIKDKMRGRKGKQLLDDQSDSNVEMGRRYEPTRNESFMREPPRYG